MISIRRFWLNLLYWYNRYQRDFPWRNTSSAYEVLIAELLLQQTHVRKVETVYCQLLNSYPDIPSMAGADVNKVQEIIKPIGLKYRAERLIAIANIIQNSFRGQVPNDKKYLAKLPGVGDYISDAVLCYAFNKPTVPIDTNVIRLFTRYCNLTTTKSRARCDKKLADDIRYLYVFKNTRTPNLAVLDFASAICTAKNPSCNKCLLNSGCSFN